MTFLLDVNVLIAAIWTNHVHHARADGWIARKSIALCPISELGFLRISSHPRGLVASMTDAKRLLEHFRVQNHAVFVPADIASTGIMAEATCRRKRLQDDAFCQEKRVVNLLRLLWFVWGIAVIFFSYFETLRLAYGMR